MDVTKLKRLGACCDALDWLESQPNATEAWKTCQRGDWMLWLLGRLCKHGGKRHRKVVLAACDCASLSLRHVPDGEDRPAAAIALTRRWASGDDSISLGDLQAARWAAVAAGWEAEAGAGAVAAEAAADAAGWAAEAGAGWAVGAGAATFAECADIVRLYFPKPPRIPAKQPGGR